MPVQIDVKYEGDSVQAMQITEGVYRHTLKLHAASPFKLVKTVSNRCASLEPPHMSTLSPQVPRR